MNIVYCSPVLSAPKSRVHHIIPWVMYTPLGNYSHEAKVSFNGANPSYVRFVVEDIGFEPMTPCVQGKCSSQLS